MADTLDILAEAEAVQAINRTGAAPADLPQMVTAVSRVIDALVGPVVVRTVTAELHAGGTCAVYLHRRPVTSVTTVREAQAPGTIETLAAVAWGAAGSGYFAPASIDDPTLKSGVIRRKLNGRDSEFYPGSDAVEVTYVAGRYANTAAVDERFKECCAAVLRRLWKREAGAWSQTPTFLEQADASPSSGFYRAVRPIVEELLADEVQLASLGFA